MTGAAVDADSASHRLLGRVSVLVACLTALVVASRGIADEGAVSLQGDMPRYLMNGAFLYDALRALPLGDPVAYAQQYYARYPALSLGHHPLLLPIALVPAFLALGISVFTGRAVVVLFFIVGAALWHGLLRRYFGTAVAFFSTMLLILTPSVIEQSQAVLSEVPTLALVFLSLAMLDRYARTGRTRDAALFGLAVAASVWSKQLAVFMVPVYLAYFVIAKGWRALLSRDVVVAGLIAAILVAPLVPLTLRLSRFNMTVVTKYVQEEKGGRFTLRNVLTVANRIRERQLPLPLAALPLMAVAVGAVRRERRTLVPLVWVGTFYGGLVALGVFNVRYAFYMLPAICLLCAIPLAFRWPGRWRLAWGVLLAAGMGYQAVMAVDIQPTYARGYEEVARFVTTNSASHPVFYSAAVDTGYFVFFVRKHDPRHEHVVLRADKLFTTSRMSELALESRVSSPEEILQTLVRFGAKYVVIESGTYPEGPLTWLQQQVTTPRFARRLSVPIHSLRPRLRGHTLDVYEFLDARPPERDASLDLHLPLIGERIEVRLSDLLPPHDR